MGVIFIIMLAVVAIVAIESISDIYKTRIKVREKDSEAPSLAIMERIKRIEERICNLETIIVQSEREKQFKDLEKDSREQV